MLRFLAACAAAFLFCAYDASAKPMRVVSLDYCADQFVLALADRTQIAALSRGALRDDSYFRDRAVGLPRTRGTLEEVLALSPDLIVRNWGGPWDAEQVYARFDMPVLQVGDATSFDLAREDVRDAARVLDQTARGETLVRDLDTRLARLAALPPPRDPNVMYLSAGGAVAGGGTLLDSVIHAAGGRNAWPGQSWTLLPLEHMVETPPALIALGFFESGRVRMNAWTPARHPALRRALAQARTVSLPTDAISCEAWFQIDAAELIARELRT